MLQHICETVCFNQTQIKEWRKRDGEKLPIHDFGSPGAITMLQHKTRIVEQVLDKLDINYCIT